jgi:hypothetical protein
MFVHLKRALDSINKSQIIKKELVVRKLLLMHKFKWSKGKGMSSWTHLLTEMHLGHNTMLVCLLKLVIDSNESLWATLDIWLIPYYHSSLCLEDGGMSQISLKSYSFEVDACTSWHRIDFLKKPTACVGSVLIFQNILGSWSLWPYWSICDYSSLCLFDG